MKLRKLLNKIASGKLLPVPMAQASSWTEGVIVIVEDGNKHTRESGGDQVRRLSAVGHFYPCKLPRTIIRLFDGFKPLATSSFVKEYLERKRLPIEIDMDNSQEAWIRAVVRRPLPGMQQPLPHPIVIVHQNCTSEAS